MSQFEHALNLAAETVLNTFRLTAEYFYEDRKSGNRLQIRCIERTIEIVEADRNGETIVRTGKGFLMSRADWEGIDTWRRDMNIDVAVAPFRKEPTPAGGDYIVRVKDGTAEWYEITYREPYSVIGANRALYRINTIFVKRDD